MPSLTETREIGAGATPVTLVESGDLAADGQTPWMLLGGDGEHVFTCDVVDKGSGAGTFVIEGRRTYKDASTGTTRALFSSTVLTDFPQVGRLAGWWEVRVRWVRSAGTVNLSVSQ